MREGGVGSPTHYKKERDNITAAPPKELSVLSIFRRRYPCRGSCIEKVTGFLSKKALQKG